MLLMEALISADVISNDISWGRKVLDMLGYFTKIYSDVALALFCILARTSACTFAPSNFASEFNLLMSWLNFKIVN